MKASIIILATVALFMSACQKKVLSSPNANVVTTPSVATMATQQTWFTEPNASSSKIRIFTDQPQAIINGVLAVGLPQMGFKVIENTGSYLETNSSIAETEYVKVKAWVDGKSVIITSMVEQFEQSDFGLPVSKGFEVCTKGSSPYGGECWRTIVIIANHIEGEKRYQ